MDRDTDGAAAGCAPRRRGVRRPERAEVRPPDAIGDAQVPSRARRLRWPRPLAVRLATPDARERAVLVGIVLLVALPVLGLALANGPYGPTEDHALLELGVRRVAAGHPPTLGVYSRFGWYHPGPALYYLLAGPYLLLGGSSMALPVGCACGQRSVPGGGGAARAPAPGAAGSPVGPARLPAVPAPASRQLPARGVEPLPADVAVPRRRAPVLGGAAGRPLGPTGRAGDPVRVRAGARQLRGGSRGAARGHRRPSGVAAPAPWRAGPDRRGVGRSVAPRRCSCGFRPCGNS